MGYGIHFFHFFCVLFFWAIVQAAAIIGDSWIGGRFGWLVGLVGGLVVCASAAAVLIKLGGGWNAVVGSLPLKTGKIDTTQNWVWILLAGIFLGLLWGSVLTRLGENILDSKPVSIVPLITLIAATAALIIGIAKRMGS